MTLSGIAVWKLDGPLSMLPTGQLIVTYPVQLESGRPSRHLCEATVSTFTEAVRRTKAVGAAPERRDEQELSP